MTVTAGRAQVDAMLADGKIDLDTAATINRFAAFLRVAGPPRAAPLTDDERAEIAALTETQKLERLTARYGAEMAAYLLDPNYDGPVPGEDDQW